MADHLLPPNASQAEIALDLAMALIDDVAVPLRDLWNPDTCPEELLPWLAWALSVGLWRPSWPVDVKRRVIKANMAIKRKLGTRGAVEDALAVLGASVESTEWWETDPPGEPGTFDLIAWANRNLSGEGVLLSDTLLADLKAAVDYSKNVRSHYTFKVGAKFDVGAGLGAGTGSLSMARKSVSPDLETDMRAGMATGAAARGRILRRSTAVLGLHIPNVNASVSTAGAVRGLSVRRAGLSPGIKADVSASLGVAGGGTALNVQRFTMEVAL